jgi:hypothetical protein
MAPSSPRDTLAFPFAAACWAAAGTVIASLANLGLTMSRFMGDGSMPDVMRDVLPGLVGQGVLGASLLAGVVFVVAERRQARAPDRVGHASGAAAATGLLAALIAWAAASVAYALAYSQFTPLQSPVGLAAVGVAVSLLHLAAAALGASVGTALLPQTGEPPPPAAPSREAWAGVAVFGISLAFGIDLVLGALPGVLHGAFGGDVFIAARWSPFVALGVGGTAALGYAWRRRLAPEPLARAGDAWAALATLPVALLLATGLGAAAVVLAYLMSDGELPALAALGLVLVVVTGLAFAGLGALAGAMRTRRGAPAG